MSAQHLPQKSLIDLHTHSTFSDGKDTPTQLMQECAAKGIETIALTDHDTVSGWEPAERAAQENGINFVGGIELSTRSKDNLSIHLLGYLLDPKNKQLIELLDNQKTTRQNRAQKMVENLSADFPITWEEVVEYYHNQQVKTHEDSPSPNSPVADSSGIDLISTLGRPHIADLLKAKKVVKSREEAFNKILHTTSPYYEDFDTLSVLDALELIKTAGGVPILAHPYAQTRQTAPSLSELNLWVEAGLEGLEIYHREHSAQAISELKKIAHDQNLIITGSSDYHGQDGKPNQLGEHFTSPEALETIAKRATGRTVQYASDHR